MLATAEITCTETDDTRAPWPVVRIQYANIEDFLVDYTSNETIGGMFVKSRNPLPVGSRFRMCVELPGGRNSIDVDAEVRWTLPREVAAPMSPGMGVRFGRLSSVDRNRIEALLTNWR